MKRAAAWILAAMTAVSLLSGGLAEPTEYIVGEKIVPTLPLPPLEEGKIVELPVEKDPKIGPHEECFIFEGDDTKAPTGYADPSITVNIGRGRAEYTFESGGKQRTDTANYIYAKVKIAHPSQIRTAMAGTLRTDNTSLGSSLAQREKAVVAINADYGGSKTFKGSVYRQGKELRLNSKGNVDVLVIDKNGDLVILPKATNEDVQRAAAEGAVNIFTFGPALVLDGQPQYGYTERSMDTEGRAQRMAIAQLGPLEYLLITSEGPEDPGCTGLSLDRFVDLVASFGVKNAYNLDGGSCSTLIFRKNGKWAKINAPKNPKKRPLKDIIYFADAWEVNETEEVGE